MMQFAPFRPGAVYPYLHSVDFAEHSWSDRGAMPLGSQQIELLCSCCPYLTSLAITLCHDCSTTACQPLQQLTALMELRLHTLGLMAAPPVNIAAQLTQLRQLHLQGFPGLLDPGLLQLTALTSLDELRLQTQAAWIDLNTYRFFKSMVC